MRRRAALLVAGLGFVALTGCGAVKGERVLVDEDGSSFSSDDVAARPVDEVSANGASGDPATADSIDTGDSGSTVTTAALMPVVEIAETEPVPAAFAFSATSLDGEVLEGAELFERAPAIMTFVRADCDYSEDEVPKIVEAAERHPDVTFVVVASGETGPDAPWLSGIAAGRDNVVVVDDRDDSLWYRFAITATPSNVLVDDAGLMRSSYGALAESGLDRASVAVVAGFA
ncbi:hypothetical protein BDK89_1612 [Ilumatobacter fluminis]|uniref:AhpC/TSA family protein n=1 Tax=Ilumatobacter fluminis TaxID=467091 RepID=A0A4R7HZ00_9ACTN|nr:hypothetical protein [Ilumatobacter fluminis]TDT16030.1 hypothetical protein BDK89_1612 [Ilumatobacter fluminis]